MRALLLGADGMLGQAIQRVNPGHTLLPLTRRALDLRDLSGLDATLATLNPDVVIFCAAVSDVDRCATDPEAWAVNVEAPAAFAARLPTWFVSSNYVFGVGAGPHAPDAVPSPVNAYGAQKAEAERRVLAAGGHVVRTGWLYGPGGQNFPSSLPRRLGVEPVRALRGWPVQPTYVDDLAAALWRLPTGVSHLIGEEECDWFTFATEVAERLGAPPPEPTDALPWGARPQDARLSPATLPGWRDGVGRWLRGRSTPS